MRQMLYEARVRLRHLDWLDCLAIAIFLIGVMRPAFGQIAYNARTDVTAQAYPGTVPCPGTGCTGTATLTGANYQIPTTDFATQPIRVTDINTPATNTLGFNVQGSQSSEGNIWGVNDDFYTITQIGGWQAIVKFNPATKVSTYLGHIAGAGLRPGWTSTDAYTVFEPAQCPAATTGCSQYDAIIWQYNFTGLTSIPTPTVFVDLTTTCGLPNYSGATFEADLTLSQDDQTFTTALCNSGTCSQSSPGDVYALNYNRTNGCSYLRTDTWNVYDNGTLLGAATSPAQNFTLHNAIGSAAGSFLRFEIGTCTTCSPTAWYYTWVPFTTTVYTSTTGNDCGHVANGFNVVVNKCAGTYNNGLGWVPYNNLNSWTSLPAVYPSPSNINSAHISNAMANSTDTNPFCVDFTYSATTYAWDNEIVCQAQDGSGRSWRITHDWGSSAIASTQPVTCSHDGKYCLFQSDWLG